MLPSVELPGVIVCLGTVNEDEEVAGVLKVIVVGLGADVVVVSTGPFILVVFVFLPEASLVFVIVIVSPFYLF